MLEKLLSVIVPIYNSENFLEETIKSILASDYKNLELVLVDDGSDDNSLDICKAWEKKDDRIRVIHKDNGGVSSARNAGIDASEGKYIAFVDSDDTVDRLMYSKLIYLMEKTDADIGWCSYYLNGKIVPCGEKTGTVMNKEQIDGNVLLPFFGVKPATAVLNTYNSIFNKVIKGNLIRDNKIYYREDLRVGEDSEYITRLVMKSSKIAFCDEALYYYIRQNPESLTTKCMTDLFPIKVKRYEIFKSLCSDFAPTHEVTAMEFFKHEAECLNHYSVFLGFHEFSKCAKEIWDCNYIKDAYKEFPEKAVSIVGSGIAYAHKTNSFFLYIFIGHQKNRVLRMKRCILRAVKKIRKG